MTRPVRLELSRAKGFSLQATSIAANGLPAVNVARPTKWGNPWKIDKAREIGFSGTREELAEMCAAFFANSLARGLPATAAIAGALHELRGKNLACWCGISHDPYTPCHADVLISIANGIPMEEVVGENIRRAKGETLR